jgi:SAM-dependent methyltransferase
MDPSTFYLGKYRDQLEYQKTWLGFSAPEKADSVEHLLARNSVRPFRIIEIGCGTGAVLLELRRRGIARQYFAVDISAEALASLTAQAQDVHCIQADVRRPWTPPDLEFDCVILSHVLEHLTRPADLLISLSSLIRHRALIAEVPLEDLPAARIKNLFRDRSANAAGHVQFFGVSSLQALVRSSGYTIIDERLYCPALTPAIIDVVAGQERFSRSRKAIFTLTNHYGPKYLQRPWSRFYHGHFAVLARPIASAPSPPGGQT